jgi:F0F1-type ATP synthase assembly protein I
LKPFATVRAVGYTSGNDRHRFCRSVMGSNFARSIALGITLLLILVAFGGLGFLADTLLETLPVFLLIGLVVGFALGLYYMYTTLKNMGNG